MVIAYEKVKRDKNSYKESVDKHLENVDADWRLSDKAPHEEVLYPRPDDSQFSSASVDITPSEKIYKMEYPVNTITPERIQRHGEKMNTDSEPILRPGNVYLIAASENLEFVSDDKVAISDTRSTLARLGVNAQIVGRDKNARLGLKDNQQIAMQVKPKKFSIKITPENPKSSLVQLRFQARYRDETFNFDDLLRNYESKINLERNGEEIDWDEAHNENYVDGNGINFHAHINFFYKARDDIGEPIDITKENFYDPGDFFEMIETENEEILLNENKLYLLGTEEIVKLDSDLCGEIGRNSRHLQRDVPIHEAGFVGGGWKGSLTLEIIPHGDMVFAPGYVGSMRVEKIVGLDDKDEYEKTDYIGQESPKLPKVFKGS